MAISTDQNLQSSLKILYTQSKMAPSAVETTTQLASELQKVKLYPGHVDGAYKELSPITYQREAEEKGVDGHAAAKVSDLNSITHHPLTDLSVSQLSSYLECRPSLSPPRTLRTLRPRKRCRPKLPQSHQIRNQSLPSHSYYRHRDRGHPTKLPLQRRQR